MSTKMSKMSTNYTVKKKINSGGYGEVFAGRRNSDNKKVAIKKKPLKEIKFTPQMRPWEMALSQFCQNVDGVLSVLDFYQDGRFGYFVMSTPEHSCTDLWSYLRSSGPQTCNKIADICSQVF